MGLTPQFVLQPLFVQVMHVCVFTYLYSYIYDTYENYQPEKCKYKIPASIPAQSFSKVMFFLIQYDCTFCQLKRKCNHPEKLLASQKCFQNMTVHQNQLEGGSVLYLTISQTMLTRSEFWVLRLWDHLNYHNFYFTHSF